MYVCTYVVIKGLGCDLGNEWFLLFRRLSNVTMNRRGTWRALAGFIIIILSAFYVFSQVEVCIMSRSFVRVNSFTSLELILPWLLYRDSHWQETKQTSVYRCSQAYWV